MPTPVNRLAIPAIIIPANDAQLARLAETIYVTFTSTLPAIVVEPGLVFTSCPGMASLVFRPDVGIGKVRINLCRGNAGMAQQLLHVAQGRAVLQ